MVDIAFLAIQLLYYRTEKAITCYWGCAAVSKFDKNIVLIFVND